MYRIATLAVACALVCSVAHRASAQQTSITPNQSTIDPTLAAQAKITLDSARIIALEKGAARFRGVRRARARERTPDLLVRREGAWQVGNPGGERQRAHGQGARRASRGASDRAEGGARGQCGRAQAWRIARVALIVARELSNESNPPTDTPSAKAGVGLFVALAAIGLLLWGFAALADGFNEKGRIARLDLAVLNWLQHHGTESGESVFVFVSWLGAPVLVAVDVAVAASGSRLRRTVAMVRAVDRRDRRRAAARRDAQARISSRTPVGGFGIHHQELVELSQWPCNELAGRLRDARVPPARARHEHSARAWLWRSAPSFSSPRSASADSTSAYTT